MNKRNIALTKNPFWEIEKNFFNDPFFRSRFFSPTKFERAETVLVSSEYEEDDQKYLVSVEIPGIPKEAISINADQNSLRISGERKEEKLENGRQKHYSEFYYGKFNREYHFSESIDTEKITASYKDGILKIEAPKSTQSQTKKITIN